MAENRCYAYNASKQRCDLDAGHASDHSITMSWTDEECYDPTAPLELTLTEYGVPRVLPAGTVIDFTEEEKALGPVPIYGEGKPGFCVMCNHPMHGGECSRCDCKSGIPG